MRQVCGFVVLLIQHVEDMRECPIVYIWIFWWPVTNALKFFLLFLLLILGSSMLWIKWTIAWRNCEKNRWLWVKNGTYYSCQWIYWNTMNSWALWTNVRPFEKSPEKYSIDNISFVSFTDELDEIKCYAQRISNRLATVDISVKTVRDSAQEEALHQVNSLIDSLLTVRDRVLARQRCQTFLNACSVHEDPASSADLEQVVDKKFETAVLGCTLDDQKTIKKRLQALMSYLNKQTVSE